MDRGVKVSCQILAVIAVVILLAPGFGRSAPPSTGNIDGYVKDAVTAGAISGALVQVIGTTKTATSDSTGYYKVTKVNTGTYDVKASAPGYLDYTQSGVVVTKDVTTRVNFNLQPRPSPGYVDGYVYDGGTLQPISGARASLVGTSFYADSAASGMFIITADPGTYTLKVTMSGYEDHTHPSQVTVESSVTTHVGSVYLAKAVLKLPMAVQRSSAAWTGSRALVFGGLDSSSGQLNQVIKYDTSADSSTVVQGIFASARSDTSAVWTGQYAYVFGGMKADGNAMKEVVRYNPVDDSKTTYATALPTTVYGTSAVWTGTYAYIFGGRYIKNGNPVYVKDIVKWDPSSNTATKLSASLPSGRVWTAAAYDGQYAYVFGGMLSVGYTNQIIRFDPATNQVTTLSAVLPIAMCSMVAMRDAGNILVMGGWRDASKYDTVLELNKTTQQLKPRTVTLPFVLGWSCGINDGYTDFLFGGSTEGGAGPINAITRYHSYSAAPNYGVEPYDVFIGGMVNAAGGNLVLSAEDTSVRGRGYTISFTRTYNSQLSGKLGSLGYGWTHNYEMSVTAGQKYGDAILTDACGSQHLFLKKSDGSYVTPPGSNDKLTKNPSTGEYTLWSLDGSQTKFDSQGKLAMLMDKNGNRLWMIYDSFGKLARVRDDSGQYLQIEYGANGRISKVSDEIGQSMYYVYTTRVNGDLCLMEVGYQDPSMPLVHMTYLDYSRVMDTVRYYVVDKYIPMYGTTLLVDDCTDFNYDTNGRVTEIWKFESADIYFPQPIYPAVRQYLIQYVDRTMTIATCSLAKTMNVSLSADGLPLKIWGAPLAGAVGSSGGCGASLLFPGRQGNEEITLTWNRMFLVKTSADGRGYVYTNEYNSYGFVTKATDPAQKYSTYEYKIVDSSAKYLALLMNATDPLGYRTQYLYDEKGNNVKVVDALGNYTESWYNEHGLVNRLKDARGYVTTFNYDQDSSWNALKAGSGGITNWMNVRYSDARSYSPTRSVETSFTSGPSSYDTGVGYMSKEFSVKPIQEISLKLYCDQYYHNKHSGDTMDAGVRIRQYDSGGVNYANYTYWLAAWRGSADNKTPGADTKVIWGKPPMNSWVPVVLHPSSDWTIDWDRCAKTRIDIYFYVSYSVGDNLRLYYDDLAVDRIVTNGAMVTDPFDSHGYPVGGTTPLGPMSQASYDEIGQVTDYTTLHGYVTSYEYFFGDVSNTTYPDGSFEAVYRTYQGEPIRRVSSGVGDQSYGINVTLRTYDYVTDALNHTTRYYYNSMGHLVKIVDANGHAATLSYELARLKRVTLPMGETFELWYDKAGNIIKRMDANGNITLYSYDSLNRLIQTTYPDGKEVTRSYDAMSRPIVTSGLDFWEKNTYDALGRIVTVTTSYNFTDRTGTRLQYNVTESLVYDQNGNVVSDTFQDGSYTIQTQYTYDAVNRVSRVDTHTGLHWRFYYDQDGRRSSMFVYNGSSPMSSPFFNTTYVYNSMGDVLYQNVSKGSGEAPIVLSYEYDAAGRIVEALNDVTWSGFGYVKSYAYSYDDMGQLVGYAVNGVWTNYTYDPVGNRLSKVAGSTTTTYTYDANDRLVSTSAGTQYDYDDNGNMIYQSSPYSRLAYDYENHIVASVDGYVKLNYSGDGNLMVKYQRFEPGWSPIFNVYSHMPGLPTIAVAVEWGLDGYYYDMFWMFPGTDELLGYSSYYSDSGLYQFVAGVDALGNTLALIDPNTGSLVDWQAYSPFGEMVYGPTGPYDIWSIVPSFQGRTFEYYLGMYDFRARHYMPSVGRFAQADPAPNYGASTYVFVGNNPVMGRDPTGAYTIVLNCNWKIFFFVVSLGLALMGWAITDKIMTVLYNSYVVTAVTSIKPLLTKTIYDIAWVAAQMAYNVIKTVIQMMSWWAKAGSILKLAASWAIWPLKIIGLLWTFTVGIYNLKQGGCI
jgi:RHS repeat-associated protein